MNRRDFIKVGSLFVPACIASAQSGSPFDPTFVPMPKVPTAAWYDSVLAGATDSETSLTPGFYRYCSITVTTGGTSDKARFAAGTYGGSDNVKMALYSADLSTLLASGTLNSVSSGNQYFEVPWDTPVVLSSATNYALAFTNEIGFVQLRYLAGGGASDVNSCAYGSFPPSSLSSLFPNSNAFALGVHIQ